MGVPWILGGGAVEIFANKQWNNGFINFWGRESPRFVNNETMV